MAEKKITCDAWAASKPKPFMIDSGRVDGMDHAMWTHELSCCLDVFCSIDIGECGPHFVLWVIPPVRLMGDIWIINWLDEWILNHFSTITLPMMGGKQTS